MKLRFKHPRLRRGQSLIEVMIAFTVSVVIGIALVNAGLATQRASISARNNSQATKLAQEYLEDIRLIRDVAGYSAFDSPTDPRFQLSGFVDTCWRINTNSSTDPSAWRFTSISRNLAVCNPNTPYANDEKVTLNNTVFSRRLVVHIVTTNLSRKFTAKVVWNEGTNIRSVNEETTLTQWCGGAVTAGAACPP